MSELETEVKKLNHYLLSPEVRDEKSGTVLLFSQREWRARKVLLGIKRKLAVMLYDHNMHLLTKPGGSRFFPPEARIPRQWNNIVPGSWVDILYFDNSHILGIVINVRVTNSSSTHVYQEYEVLQVDKRRLKFSDSAVCHAVARPGFQLKKGDCRIRFIHFVRSPLAAKMWIMRHKFKKLVPYIRKWKLRRS